MSYHLPDQQLPSGRYFGPYHFHKSEWKWEHLLGHVLNLSGFSLWSYTNKVSFFHQPPHLKNVKLNTHCLEVGMPCAQASLNYDCLYLRLSFSFVIKFGLWVHYWIPCCFGFQLCCFWLITHPDCITISCCDQDYLVSAPKLIENSSSNCIPPKKKLNVVLLSKNRSNVYRIIMNNIKESQINLVYRRSIYTIIIWVSAL